MTHPLSAPAPGGDDRNNRGNRDSMAKETGQHHTDGAGGANPRFGDGGANGTPSGTGTDYKSTSGAGRSELARLIAQLESIEIRTDRDLYRYARLLRRIGMELSLRIALDADWLAALLSQYKGRWYTFGTESRIRGRLVAGHLKQGAKAAEVVGMAGIKAYAAFQRHFVKPEIEAQQRNRRSKDGGFTITQTQAENRKGNQA